LTVIYLAHSTRERKKGKEIQKQLEDLGFKVINPFYPETPRPDIVALDKGIARPWQLTKKTSLDLVKQDLRAIRLSDIVIAIIPEEERTFGIPCEVMYAYMLDIPIYIITIAMSGHPWILTLATAVFKTVEELYDMFRSEEEAEAEVEYQIAISEEQARAEWEAEQEYLEQRDREIAMEEGHSNEVPLFF